jgi:hypothetical protein
MKNTVFLILALFLTTSTLYAKQWTVSNNVNIPAQFFDLQEAINTASAGDTLLIAGSPVSYESINIGVKRLTFIGNGAYTFGNNFSTKIEYARRSPVNIFSPIYNGSTFIGIDLTFVFDHSDQLVTKWVISRCKVKFYNLSSQYSLDTISVINSTITDFNISNSSADVFGGKNFKIMNCYVSSELKNLRRVEFYNCIFFNAEFNPDAIYYRNRFNTFISCILYSRQLLTELQNDASNFIKCITYLTDQDNLTFGSNQGFGNITGNPLFVNPKQVGIFNDSADYSLQPTSPARNAGFDGTDIGPTGGLYPMLPIYLRQSPLPAITFINSPATTTTTNPLSIQVRAKKRD